MELSSIITLLLCVFMLIFIINDVIQSGEITGLKYERDQLKKELRDLPNRTKTLMDKIREQELALEGKDDQISMLKDYIDQLSEK